MRLFEFNDAAWVPEVLRRTIVDALGRTIRWSHLLDGVAAPLAECLERAQCTEILDLCSGNGDAAASLVVALERLGIFPRVHVSDLHPRPDLWRETCSHEAISQHSESVDATGLSEALSRDRVLTICNALHHFPPALAKAALLEMTRHARGIFVVEGLNPSPWSFAAMAPMGVLALMATPALTPRRSLTQMALTWGTPLVLGMSVWDGVVSAKRTHTPEQLLEMVAERSGWEWRWGTFRHSLGLGRGSWFSGVRARGS